MLDFFPSAWLYNGKSNKPRLLLRMDYWYLATHLHLEKSAHVPLKQHAWFLLQSDPRSGFGGVCFAFLLEAKIPQSVRAYCVIYAPIAFGFKVWLVFTSRFIGEGKRILGYEWDEAFVTLARYWVLEESYIKTVVRLLICLCDLYFSNMVRHPQAFD